MTKSTTKLRFLVTRSSHFCATAWGQTAGQFGSSAMPGQISFVGVPSLFLSAGPSVYSKKLLLFSGRKYKKWTVLQFPHSPPPKTYSLKQVQPEYQGCVRAPLQTHDAIRQHHLVQSPQQVGEVETCLIVR